jgi:hypothetical protein
VEQRGEGREDIGGRRRRRRRGGGGDKFAVSQTRKMREKVKRKKKSI